MNTERICPNCRKPLPPDVPLGLCPECLIKSGFPTGTEPGAAGARFVPPPVEEITRLFPQLEILGLIGKGGMGAVYKARQPALDRFVALKVLPPAVAGDPGFAERFNREARALARLNHPNIVAVHDFGKAGTLHYLVMEFVDGANLREIERSGKLSPEQALAIVPQICEALQFAHNEGIVHRDIKPENLLLDKRGRLKITDFGIAKIIGVPAAKATLTGAKDIVGTPHYMAPEQIEKPQSVDHRADIYSLGVVFYEMLTGELPLGKFPPPSKRVHVDVRLDEVVLHALEKEPERRYQQAQQVKTDVETIATTASSTAPQPPQSTGFAAAGGAGPPRIPSPNVPCKTGRIVAPAIALMIAGALKLASGLAALLLFAWPGNPLLDSVFFHSIFSNLGIYSPYHWNALIGFSAVIFKVIPALVILFGAVQMIQLRNYAWAVAAAVVSIVACSLVGLPAGIWALIILSLDSVRNTFANPPPHPSPSSAKWPWILTAAVLAGCFLLLESSLPRYRAVADQAATSVVSKSGRHENAKPAQRTNTTPTGNNNVAIVKPQATGTKTNSATAAANYPPTNILAEARGGAASGANTGSGSVGTATNSLNETGTLAVSSPGPGANKSPSPAGPESNQANAAGKHARAAAISLNITTNIPQSTTARAAQATKPVPQKAAVAIAPTNSIQQTIAIGDKEDFSKALSVRPGGKLTLNVDRGDIRVVGSDQDTAEIQVDREVSRADGAEAARILKEEQVVLKQDGNEISITAHDPPSLHRHSWWGTWTQPNLNVHYRITVPRRFNVQLDTLGGGIKVADLQGGVKVKTLGGGLDFDNLQGTVNGQTSGGNVHAAGCASNLCVQTLGGNITIDKFSGPGVRATTEGGSVSVDFLTAPKSECDLHTSGGGVTARIPKTAAVTLDAHTLGGAVTTDLPVQVEGRVKPSRLEGTINGGGPLLKLETLGGNIEILKR